MKRNALLKHLQESGCTLKREGKKHSWYVNSINGKLSAVPRHTEIKNTMCDEICKQLGIAKKQ